MIIRKFLTSSYSVSEAFDLAKSMKTWKVPMGSYTGWRYRYGEWLTVDGMWRGGMTILECIAGTGDIEIIESHGDIETDIGWLSLKMWRDISSGILRLSWEKYIGFAEALSDTTYVIDLTP